MSDRLKTISKLKENRSSRIAYTKAKLSVLIPAQLKALRLKSETPRQEDLAIIAEMKQSRISAMEKPGAVNFNLETLVRMAAAFKVGLIVKFVSFSEMLRWENSFSQDLFEVKTVDHDSEFLHSNSAAAWEGLTLKSFWSAVDMNLQELARGLQGEPESHSGVVAKTQEFDRKQESGQVHPCVIDAALASGVEQGPRI